MKPQNIPNYQLAQPEENIFFEIRRMEDIDERNQGKADHPHRHNYFTIIWSFEAKGKHYIDFKEYNIAPNYIFFVMPGQVHQVATEANPTGIVILFTRDFLQHNHIRESFISDLRIFRDCEANPPLMLESEHTSKLRQFAETMHQLQHKQTDSLAYEEIGAYLKLFLIECNRLCDLETENTQQIYAGQHILQHFKDLVEVNFRDWHKVGQYAEELSITAGHLNDTIKSLLGQTAKEYIQRRINLEAKRLALFSENNAKAIAYDLGFEDPSHFSKFFRKYNQQTFGNFRRQYTS